MKVATFNVNGIASRLPRLLEWLGEAERATRAFGSTICCSAPKPGHASPGPASTPMFAAGRAPATMRRPGSG